MSAPSPTPSRPEDGPGRLPWGETWPAVADFRTLARGRRVIPVVRRLLADDLAPVGIYRRLAGGRPGTFILESAEHDGSWSRWSFVGAASRATLTGRGGAAVWTGDVPVGIPRRGPLLDVLRTTLDVLRTDPLPGLPPLTSGLVGALGWDVLRTWEPTLRAEAPVELDAPDAALCLATDMAAVDHQDGSVWLIANAVNFDDRPERVDEAHADAVARLDAMQARLLAPAPAQVGALDAAGTEPELSFRTSRDQFEQAVRRGKEYIRDGDVFQVVLSQRADVDCPAEPLDVYRVLRTINPSPYMYLFVLRDDGTGDAGDAGGTVRAGLTGSGRDGSFAVVGSSPETLVRAQDGTVTTFPIAGSRPRGATAGEDHDLAQDLLKDPKELAEHVMLVDLARNDLAKVCDPGSVEVVDLMEIKRFSHIMHISSTVAGTLRGDVGALDALVATFPAGTLSGAPKPRAIEIIDELEPARRGIYGGVLGYLDLAGNLDMAIAIRTAFIRDGRAAVQAGAGIVADSVPATEYAEVRNKAAAAVRAIQVAARLTRAGD